MGQIKEIINRIYNFDVNSAGYYDKKVKVFRRKLSNGLYERNVIEQKNSSCFGTDKITLSGKIKVIIDWFPDSQNTRSGTLFSLTDWERARTIYIKGHIGNSLHIAMYDCASNLYGTCKYRIKIFDVAPELNTHNILTVVFDFENWVIEEVTNSAMVLPSPESYSIDGQPSPFLNLTYKHTYEIGNWDIGSSNEYFRGFGRISSIYVEDVNRGTCLLNFDFCGDTPSERLTEKAHLYQLVSNRSAISWEEDNVSL